MKIPESHVDLLEGKSLAHIATSSKAGVPHSSPVWMGKGEDLETVVFVTSKGTKKYQNLAENKKFAASLVDTENPFRCLMLQGKVTSIETDKDKVFSTLNSLSHKYAGKDYGSKPDLAMVLFKISITKAHSF